RSNTADAQQHLLAEPVLAVAAVEPVGDIAHRLRVLLNVGVQQQQWYSADLRHPDPGHQVVLSWQSDGDAHGIGLGIPQQRDRQPVWVQYGVALLLPPVAGQRLSEVAVPVEQSDTDDGNSEV